MKYDVSKRKPIHNYDVTKDTYIMTSHRKPIDNYDVTNAT